MNVKIVTIFPQAFPSTLGLGLVGKALNKKIWDLQIIDLKKYGRYLDDRPFGGGNGMILRPTIIEKSIEENNLQNIIFLSPRGKAFQNNMSVEMSNLDEISIICGRYEGVDQRVIDYYQIKEVSLGDFILCGGESAALTIVESIIRNIPGVLGNENSLSQESFSDSLLEHHHYTHPRIWKNMKVEDVLISGDHNLIARYRYNQSILITQKRRPDLFISYIINRIISFIFMIMLKSLYK